MSGASGVRRGEHGGATTLSHHHHHHHHGGATPVLDIGGEIGAVVVYLAAPTPSGELEMCPFGVPEGRFHTGVHDRDLAGFAVPVAVFPEVAAGRYQLLDDDLMPIAALDVHGGEVTELDLR